MIASNSNLVIENLYYLLWLKDAGLKEDSYSVRIPDTLVLNYGRITNWYFSPSNGKGILMKKKNNLTPENIFENFTRKESTSGIVAKLIENVRNEPI